MTESIDRAEQWREMVGRAEARVREAFARPPRKVEEPNAAPSGPQIEPGPSPIASIAESLRGPAVQETDVDTSVRRDMSFAAVEARVEARADRRAERAGSADAGGGLISMPPEDPLGAELDRLVVRLRAAQERLAGIRAEGMAGHRDEWEAVQAVRTERLALDMVEEQIRANPRRRAATTRRKG
jgi:uncharacterized caspase-like protein